MRKTLLLVLALLALPPMANAADGDVFIIGDFVYKILSESYHCVELSKCYGRPVELDIPSTVTSDNGTRYTLVTIGDYAFADNSKLTSIALPVTVDKIGKWAFANCKSLTSIELPYNVTTIEEGTFNSCEALESVEIPSSVTSIGDFAFTWCWSLSSVTIPANTVEIGAGAFEYCTTLSEIASLSPTPPTIKSYDAFGGVPEDAILYVPATSIELYRAAEGWSWFANYQKLESASVGDEFTVDDISYTVLSSEEYTVEVHRYYGEDTRIEIPPTILGDDGVTYTVTSIGTGAFTGFIFGSTLTEIILPPTITSIGDVAFFLCPDLTSINIPAAVTEISESAFIGCESLNEFVVDEHNTAYSTLDGMLYNYGKTRLIACPGARSRAVVAASTTSISPCAFFLCSRLESISVEDGNISYTSADGILYNADMTILTACPGLKAKVEIPASVTAIGDMAFGGCWLITNIDIPASVTYIGDEAFMYCRSLKAITIPSSVTYIGGSVFENCGDLTSIDLNARITSISPSMFRECSSLSSINIPPTVTTIGEMAFQMCESLKSITLPSSLTSIAGDAFTGCQNMATIVSLPTVPPVINGEIDMGIPKDAVVYIPAGSRSQYLSAEGWNYFSDFREVEASDGDRFTVGELIYTIISEADHTVSVSGYEGNPKNIDIPATVKRENWAEYSVTSIKGDAFKDCGSIVSVTIPSSVTSVGMGAFYHCWSLQSVTIPESLSSLPHDAFWLCSSLTKIVSLRATPPIITSTTFSGVPVDAAIYIPIGSRNSYKSSEYWGKFNNFIELYPGVGDEFTVDSITYTVISEADHQVEVSHYSGNATSIDIPMTVQRGNGVNYTVCRLGSRSFRSCESVTSVIIPSTVTYICDHSFAYCSALESVSIPSSVITISEYAFYKCSALPSVTIPQSVTSIGIGIFCGCENLEAINVEDNNSSYSSIDGVLYSFDKTSLLVWPAGKKQTKVDIPDFVTSIGERAFDSCRSITSVKIPSSVSSISRMAFYLCESLKSIVIPQGITTIAMQLFDGCTSLESVTLPASVTNISDAFNNCRSIEKIISLSPTPPSISDQYVFWDVPEDAAIFIPAGSLDSYSTAQGWSYFNNFREITNSAGDQFTIDDITYTVLSDSENCVEVSTYRGYSAEVEIPATVIRDDILEYTVTSVGKNAFSRSTFLKSVTIPSTVTSFADNAFWGCLSLTKLVSLTVNPPTIGTATFDYVPTDAVVYVPVGSLNKYKFADGWSYFHIFRELEDVGLTIGTSADVTDAPTEYYNLNGIRVNNEELSPGVYIKRQGGKSVKVMIP